MGIGIRNSETVKNIERTADTIDLTQPTKTSTEEGIIFVNSFRKGLKRLYSITLTVKA